ncbi:MAG: porin [Prevotella sp.]
MNTKTLTTAFLAVLTLSANATEATETQETNGGKDLKLSEVFSKPKFSGYMMGNYNATFKDEGNSNGFSLRMIRLIMTGRVLNDFEYKIQGQINGNTGTYGDSPRLIDMSLEWQKYKGFKIKAGQFKRPFTFENPMNPIDIGFTSLSQSVTNLSGFTDRTGEQSSNGRDIGVQVSGDLLPNSDGRTLLHYEIGMFNGQGLNQKEVDNQKDIIGGAWVSPLKGVRIGAFGWVGSYARKGTWQDGGVEASGIRKVGRYRYAISAEYKDADWQIRSEYIHNTGGAFTTRANKSADLQDCTLNEKLGDRADGIYLACVAPIVKGKLRAKARYDLYRPAGEWSTAKTIYKAGINYLFCKNLEIQTEYGFVNDRSLADHNYSMADIQFSVRF